MSVMRSILHGLREVGRGVDAASATWLGIPASESSAAQVRRGGSREAGR